MPAGLTYSRGVPHGLMFHRFRGEAQSTSWQGALTASELDALLRLVGPENILSPSEWMERLAAGTLRPSDLCLTFDDGLRCQVEQALPVLDAYGLKAFWFIYTSVLHGEPVRSEIYSYVAGLAGGSDAMTTAFLDRCPPEMKARLATGEFRAYEEWIRRIVPFYSDADIRFRFLRNDVSHRAAFERVMDGIVVEWGFDIPSLASELWLTREQIRGLADGGHAVGLHTYDHPYAIAAMPVEQQRQQYARNAADLLDITGLQPVSMSHPLDSYGADTLSILAGLGIRCGFRSNMADALAWAPAAGHLTVPREDAVMLRGLAAGLIAKAAHA